MSKKIELTEKEKSILESLLDKPETKSQFAWGDQLEAALLRVIMTDKEVAASVANHLRADWFGDVQYRGIATVFLKMFAISGKLPTVAELEEALATDYGRYAVAYQSALSVILAEHAPTDAEKAYLLDRLEYHIKRTGLRACFKDCFAVIFDGNLSEIDRWSIVDQHIEKWKRSGLPPKDMGLDLFAYPQQLIDKFENREPLPPRKICSTGFESINLALQDGGLCSGEIGAFMAPPATGKSIALVNAAVRNVRLGKRVLIVSLEMVADKVGGRVCSMIGGRRIDAENADMLVAAHEDFLTGIEGFDGNRERLRIKVYPAGSCTIEMLRALLTTQQMSGFSPDLLVLDYVGEMCDYTGIERHQSRERLIRELRGLAQQFDLAVLTGIQTNRTGRTAQQTGLIDDENIGDSSGQIRPLDAFWSINQGYEEYLGGVGRIFVVKHRNGTSRFEIPIAFDFQKMELREISREQYRQRLEAGRYAKRVDNFKPKY